MGNLAADIADLLVTGGLGTTVHVGELQPKPDKAVVITPTAGLPTLRTHGGAVMELMRVQIRARAIDFATVESLMATAHGRIDGIKNKTMNGRLYYWIEAIQSPFYLGLDENSRPVFACNYGIMRSMST